MCVCWPDSQHVWTCQDSVYLCSRDLPDALGYSWEARSPNRGALNTSQEERGWEARFCLQATRGPVVLPWGWPLPWAAPELNRQRRERHNPCQGGPAARVLVGTPGPTQKERTSSTQYQSRGCSLVQSERAEEREPEKNIHRVEEFFLFISVLNKH